MIQSSLSIPTLEIAHDHSVPFKRVFTFKNTDGTLRNIDDIVPVFDITEKGTVIISMSGSDIEKTEISEMIIKKDKSFFSDLSCLKDYKFSFYDTTTGSVLIKGTFKIL